MGEGRFPILWVSDSPLGKSGYAVQSALFTPRLAAQGHDVAIFANNHTGDPLSWNGIRVLPRFNDRMGNDLLLQHSRHHAPDGMTFILQDIWVYEPALMAQIGKVAAWTPVDHEPLQTVTDDCLQQAGAAQGRVVPVAMTHFARESFAKAGYDAPYVPHAYDPQKFQPRDRAKAREVLNVPEGAFVVGIVGDNQGIAPPRKAWPQMLEAFARFRKAKRDAVLYLHTDMLGVRGGLDLFRLIAQLEIPVGAVHVVDPYDYRVNTYSQEFMSHIYSAFDVLLHTSYGEGFGVVQIEAGACGTPQIVTDFSAMSEVGYGWKVGGHRWYTALGGWQMMPAVDQIVDALHGAYSKAESKREKAQAHASQYEVDAVFHHHMVPAVKALAERFGL